MADWPAEVGRWQNVFADGMGRSLHNSMGRGAYAPRKQAPASAPKGISDAAYIALTSELRVEEAADLAQLYRPLTLDSVALAAHPAD
jgi:hypothetical protein